jgi:DNA-binding MarR family transcriptional regulator
MTDSPDVADQMLREIRRIVRRIGQHSRALARQSGLTVPQVLCLKALGGMGTETTLSHLAQEVQLSPGTVSRLVDKLEARDLVRRVRGETDRRKVWIELTPEGRRKVASLPAPLQDDFVERLNRLPAGDRDAILAALRRVNELMDAEEIDAAPVLSPDPDLP